MKKTGILKDIPSRVEKDNKLKGTKSIIVREGNVFIGRGIKDSRHILIIPIISSRKDSINVIEKILLLNVSFKTKTPLMSRIKALGGKYQRIKNIVQEKNIKWKDLFLNEISIIDLFGNTAEATAEELELLKANMRLKDISKIIIKK